MKKTLVLITLLVVLSLACSLMALGGEPSSSQREGEASIQGEQKPTTHQSEKRCGDGVCDGPENTTNCPEDCLSAEENTATISTSSQPDAKTPPPWFAPDPGCEMRETSVFSEGSPWAFDSDGHNTELLSDGQVTCILEIQICGDTIFKQQVIGPGEDCPESLHFSHAPPTQVCCTKWEEAKLTGSPCDPLKDADCDGTANDMDTYPLDFSQQ